MPGEPPIGQNVVLNLFLQTAPSGSLGMMLPILLMFGVLYFLLFLPMQRQKKANPENAGRPPKWRRYCDQRKCPS
jgi:hypothetical protein